MGCVLDVQSCLAGGYEVRQGCYEEGKARKNQHNGHLLPLLDDEMTVCVRSQQIW